MRACRTFFSKSRKCISKPEARRQSWFSDWSKIYQLERGIEFLFLVKILHISFSGFIGEVKMYQLMRGQECHLSFLIGPQNINLVQVAISHDE